MPKKPDVFRTDKFSESFVHINNCAIVSLSDKDHYTVRENGRTDYMLVYIARGKCYATINGEEYIVNKNEAFLYHPNEPQCYHFFKTDNTIDYWVHFNGVGIDKIISSLELSGIHHLKINSDAFDIEQTLSRLCREFNSKDKYYEEICSSLLITALGTMSRRAKKEIKSQGTSDYIEHILGEIHSEPKRNFVVEDLAKEHSITSNHLINSFKEVTGFTPTQYIINIKIKKAKELLIYADYSISQIAELVGYQNSTYFSRLFKKNVGISPAKYRAKLSSKSHDLRLSRKQKPTEIE